jgi:hypothetical protein
MFTTGGWVLSHMRHPWTVCDCVEAMVPDVTLSGELVMRSWNEASSSVLQRRKLRPHPPRR